MGTLQDMSRQHLRNRSLNRTLNPNRSLNRSLNRIPSLSRIPSLTLARSRIPGRTEGVRQEMAVKFRGQAEPAIPRIQRMAGKKEAAADQLTDRSEVRLSMRSQARSRQQSSGPLRQLRHRRETPE